MFGWGLLAGRVDAVARGLPPGRTRRLLGPVERRTASLRSGRSSWGRAPGSTSGPSAGRPIGGNWPRSTRTVSAGAFRHATQLLLHGVHGPLLPGAPICSSSSRPLLVALVVVVIVVVVVDSLLPSLRADRGLSPVFRYRGQSTRDQRRRGTQGTMFHLASLLPSALPARSAAVDQRTLSESPLGEKSRATDWIERPISDALGSRELAVRCARFLRDTWIKGTS